MTNRKFVYDKLIRDKILPQMLAQGEKPKYRKLKADEYKNELIKKIAEESGELSVDSTVLFYELVDIQEAVDSLLANLGRSKDEFLAAQAAKQKKYGSFKDRLYVSTVEIPENNKWISYLEKHPDRYPEIT